MTLRRALIWLVWRMCLMGLFLLLAAKWNTPFIVAAGVVSYLAASAIIVLMRQGLANPEARLGWLKLIPLLPGQMLRDCGVLAGALWRRLARGEDVAGVYREIPFDPGLEHDREDMGRRALAVAGASLAPNTIVVGVDPHRNSLLVHQLVPTPEPPGHGDRKWPL